jgi:hypothetical protein
MENLEIRKARIEEAEFISLLARGFTEIRAHIFKI